MTKKEELMVAFPLMATLISDVDADAFARGRAEGAELEAAKIVHCTECVGGNDDTPEKDQCALWTDNGNAYCSSGTRDLREWLNSLRDSVNDEINGEDVDPTPD